MLQHFIYRTLRHPNIGNFIGKRSEQAIEFHLRYVAIDPMMFIRGNQAQKLNVSRALKDWAQLSARLTCIAVKKEVAESLFNNQELLCFLKIVDIHFMLVAYVLNHLREFYIVFVFSHVVFLLKVDGVATSTLAVGGVAFYSWGLV